MIHIQTLIEVQFDLNLSALLFQETVSEMSHQAHQGVKPNHEVISALAKAITDSGMYLKRMVESYPQTSHAGAYLTNRFWDLAGRDYIGLYPVDFHLAVSGEEAHARAADSRLQVDITVQSTVADEMRDQVKDLMRRLSAMIDDTATQFLAVAAAEPAVPAERISQDEIARILALQSRLDEALVDGRISESRYDEMQARHKAQLERLGYVL